MKNLDALETHQALAVARRWKAASQAYHDFIKEFISIVGQDEIEAHRKAKEAFNSALKFEEEVDRHNAETSIAEAEWTEYYWQSYGGHTSTATGEATATTGTRA